MVAAEHERMQTLRIGVVDPRPVVRARLIASLTAAGLEVVDAAPTDEPAPVAPDVDVWLTGAQPAAGLTGAVAHAGDVDVTDVAALVALVQRAAVVGASPAAAGEKPPFVPLSAHEEAALDGLAGGWTARECAARLGVSTKSVENARRRVLAKLDAATPVEAVRRAHELRAAGASLQRENA